MTRCWELQSVEQRTVVHVHSCSCKRRLHDWQPLFVWHAALKGSQRKQTQTYTFEFVLRFVPARACCCLSKVDQLCPRCQVTTWEMENSHSHTALGGYFGYILVFFFSGLGGRKCPSRWWGESVFIENRGRGVSEEEGGGPQVLRGCLQGGGEG